MRGVVKLHGLLSWLRLACKTWRIAAKTFVFWRDMPDSCGKIPGAPMISQNPTFNERRYEFSFWGEQSEPSKNEALKIRRSVLLLPGE